MYWLFQPWPTLLDRKNYQIELCCLTAINNHSSYNADFLFVIVVSQSKFLSYIIFKSPYNKNLVNLSPTSYQNRFLSALKFSQISISSDNIYREPSLICLQNKTTHFYHCIKCAPRHNCSWVSNRNSESTKILLGYNNDIDIKRVWVTLVAAHHLGAFSLYQLKSTF